MNNVVLLTIDALRKDVLGCYGSTSGLTPFVDSLKGQCLRFRRAQAIGPYTQASFPGILTSSYYLDYADHGKGKMLSSKRTMVSEVLKDSGITTAAFHSNPYMCGLFGWNRGWDVFYDGMDVEVTDEVPYVKGDGINHQVESWLASQPSGSASKPFFLWAHYMDIHEPYVPPRKYVDMIAASLTLSEVEMLALFRDVILPRDVSKQETVLVLKKLYDAHVRECDDFVKSFFAILEKHNLLDDTTVIITSDHGDEFAEHGGLSHDGKMFSELIDIPLLIYERDRSAGETCDRLVSNIDLSPTILNLFGMEPPREFRGQSLLPASDYPDKGCFGEAIGKRGRQKETDKPVHYYREDDAKIICDEGADSWQMFDLDADPAELNNVIQTSPRAEEMKNKLEAHINRERETRDA